MPKTLISILNKSNLFTKEFYLHTSFMGNKDKNLIFIPYGIKPMEAELKYTIIRKGKIIRNNHSILLLKNGERKEYFLESLESKDTIRIQSGDLGGGGAHIQVFIEYK